MRLAVPGRILSLAGEAPLTRVGRVDFGGVVKEINLAFVQYVLVHVGFALTVIDESKPYKDSSICARWVNYWTMKPAALERGSHEVS